MEAALQHRSHECFKLLLLLFSSPACRYMHHKLVAVMRHLGLWFKPYAEDKTIASAHRFMFPTALLCRSLMVII
jgi:hypothetical protein